MLDCRGLVSIASSKDKRHHRVSLAVDEDELHHVLRDKTLIESILDCGL